MSSYNIGDDDALPTMLPLLTAPVSPSDVSVNVLDMINQDMLLESKYRNVSTAATEVTYASQYMSSAASYSGSIAPFTSAGDVFLPSLPITTTPNTFVKPLNTFVSPSTYNPTVNPVTKPTSESAQSSSSLERSGISRTESRPDTGGVAERAVSRCDRTNATGRSERKRSLNSSRSSNSCRSSSRSDKSKSKRSRKKSESRRSSRHGDKQKSKTSKHSTAISESTTYSLDQKEKLPTSGSRPAKSSKHASKYHGLRSTCRSRSSKHGTRSPTHAKTQTTLSSGDNRMRSTTATATITRPAGTAAESTKASAPKIATHTATTLSNEVTYPSAFDALLASNTCMVTSRSRSPVTTASSTTTRSESLTTCNVTKARPPISIISPVHNSFAMHANMLSIISRSQAGAATAGAVRPAMVSPPSVKPGEQIAILPNSTTYVIPASAASPTSADNGAPKPQTRYIMPVSLSQFITSTGVTIVTTTTTVTKPRLSYTIRPTHGAFASAFMQSHSVTKTTTVCARPLTHGTFTIPGATVFTTRKVPSTRTTKPRNVVVTTESQSFAIVDSKGAYTTLTLSSDFTTTTCSSSAVTETTSGVTAASGLHTISAASDSVARPRSQYLIPIANSSNNSVSYIMTSAIGSDIIAARNATVMANSQTPATTVPAMASHTITTISSDALNRIRKRILIPGASEFSSNQRHDEGADSNRPRVPVTIIANQLIAAPISRDVSGPVTTKAPVEATVNRPLFTGTAQQNLYALTGPMKTHSSPTGALDRRMVVQVASNVPSTAITTTDSSITTRMLPAIPTPGTYIIATGMASTPVGTIPSKPSRIVLPTVHHPTLVTTTTTTSTTMVTTSYVRPLSGAVNATVRTLSSSTDRHRGQHIVQVSTTESSMPGSTTPITAYTITRTRAPQNVYAIPTTKHSEETTRNPPTMTLITFATTSAGTSTTSVAPDIVAATSARCDIVSPATTNVTASTPTLENTGNRFVIKLGPNPNVASNALSSPSAVVTTPVTTAALSPTDHLFLEPRTATSRLRTFPGPRTYSLAQRSTPTNVPRATLRNVCPRPKKCVSGPAPLQIFADVVCPPSTAQSSTAVHSKSRIALSQCAGDSTLVLPHLKNTVFKNLSSVAHPNPERVGTPRMLGPRATSERFILNRSMAMVSPQRMAATGTVMQRANTRTIRFTYTDPNANTSRAAPAAPTAPAVPAAPAALITSEDSKLTSATRKPLEASNEDNQDNN